VYIIVAGGGKVGRYLTETLVNDGYEVLLIERLKTKVEQYTEQLGGVVVQGDACEAQVLADAGAGRADVIIAVTGDDEDNLVICQMAKRKFNVGRAIARVNNPKNERIFKHLGIDATVSHTNIILAMIEQEIPSHSLWHLTHLRNSDLEMIDALLGPNSPAVNKALSTINLPPDSTVVLVVRNGKTVIPRGDLVFAAHDEVLAIVARDNRHEVRRLLVGIE
jgi:trk system potassium uptake protein TrkA